ncbi:hypothetical protein BT69DRAFT_1289696 [Atractiella rhizophila]|nr:hypothetical protein BT69DRAFT_1289696 [Atractiella rhizophila]
MEFFDKPDGNVRLLPHRCAGKWKKENMEGPLGGFYFRRDGVSRPVLTIALSTSNNLLNKAMDEAYVEQAKRVFGIKEDPKWYWVGGRHN